MSAGRRHDSRRDGGATNSYADSSLLMYIELHARSAFSFLEGASLPEELVAVCAQLGMPAMALLDTDGVYGAPRFHLAAKKAKIKAHIGAEVSVNFFSSRRHGDTEKDIRRSSKLLSPNVCGHPNHRHYRLSQGSSRLGRMDQ